MQLYSSRFIHDFQGQCFATNEIYDYLKKQNKFILRIRIKPQNLHEY